MTRFMMARIVLAVIGVLVWGYGIARDDANVRIVGIGILALTLVLRFAPRRIQRDNDEQV